MRPTQTQRAASRVFVNCPFDDDYEPLFLAMVSGIVCLGLEPHSVLEVEDSGNRLDRVRKLIASCGASLHDLSRAKATGNLSFELGVACQESFHTKRHSFFLLEEHSYRAQRSLSDLNGYDPYVHGGAIPGMLHCVVDALGHARGAKAPSLDQMETVFEGVDGFVHLQRKLGGMESVFTPDAFRQVVLAAAHLASKEEILPS